MTSVNAKDLSSSLFNLENFDPQPDEELICSICRCVFNDPVECTCRHVFCRECINSWLVHKKSCPICRKRSYSFELETVTPLIKNMISKLTLSCPNKDNGCKEKLVLDRYNNHIKICPCEEINCSNAPYCGIRCCRKDLQAHENKECKYRMLNCEKDCNLLLPAAKVNDHNCVVELKKLQQDNSQKMDKLKNQIEELNKELESLKKKLSDQEFANNVRNTSANYPSPISISSISTQSSSNSSSSFSNISLDSSFPSRGSFFSFLFRDFLEDSLNSTQNADNSQPDEIPPSVGATRDNDLDDTLNSIDAYFQNSSDESDISHTTAQPESSGPRRLLFQSEVNNGNGDARDESNNSDEEIPATQPQSQRRVLKRRISTLFSSDSEDSSLSSIVQSHRRRTRVIESDSSSSSPSELGLESERNSNNRITRSLVPLPVVNISSSESELSTPLSESSYEVRVPERTWDLLERYRSNGSSDTSDWEPSD